MSTIVAIEGRLSSTESPKQPCSGLLQGTLDMLMVEAVARVMWPADEES
jgi:hypothetical protein